MMLAYYRHQIDDELQSNASDDSNDTDEDDERWGQLSVDQKWNQVMSDLANREACWDLSDRDSYSEVPVLKDYHKESLTQNDERNESYPTFLHAVAQRSNRDFEALPEGLQQKIVKFVLEYKMTVKSNEEDSVVETTPTSTSGTPILTVAMWYHNTWLIGCLAEHCSDHLSHLLQAIKPLDKTNCLHYMFKEYLLHKAIVPVGAHGSHSTDKTKANIEMLDPYMMNVLKAFVKYASPESVVARDSAGNTPLHYALNYELCRLVSHEYLKIIQDLVMKGDEILGKKNREDQFNNEDLSPYGYLMSTEESFLKNIPNNKGNAAKHSEKPLKTGKQKSHKRKTKAKGSSGQHVDENTKAGDLQLAPGQRKELHGRDKENIISLMKKPGDSKIDVFVSANIDGESTRIRWSQIPEEQRDELFQICDSSHIFKEKTEHNNYNYVMEVAIDTDYRIEPLPGSEDNGFISSPKTTPETPERLPTPTELNSDRHIVKSSLDPPRDETLDSPHPHSRSLGTKSDSSDENGYKVSSSLGGLGEKIATDPLMNTKRRSEFARLGLPRHGNSPNEKQTTQQPPEKPEKPIKDEEEHKKAAERIRYWLKCHYIRTRPDSEAKELLYGKVASDKNMYFDATSLEDPARVVDLVQMLAQPGGFEDTLSYVRIPGLSYVQDTPDSLNVTKDSYSSNMSRQRQSRLERSLPQGRKSLVPIFDKLVEVGVRKILTLDVYDVESPSHTDGAIGRAINGIRQDFPDDKRGEESSIDVEIWNWIQFDLSIDVISYAAPKVVEIHLYWGGNRTVLRGWSCPKGLPRLNSGQKRLKKVIVHASPGIEGVKRAEIWLNEFQDELNNSESMKDVSIHWQWMPSETFNSKIGDERGQGGHFTTRTPKDPPEHKWIKAMESFRDQLGKIHDKIKNDGSRPRQVKVALIDDGVDLSSLNTYDNKVVATGLSCWDSSLDGSAVGRPWHQSTRGHGTILANMITRLNPWVRLEVMRIQDEQVRGSSAPGALRMYPESAAKAINSAIIRGVDIISMSWTIHKPANYPSDKEDSSVKALKDAIDRAREKKILMFCSAVDDVAQTSTEWLPYSQAPYYIFRIGSAGAYGQREMNTEDQHKISWFFPGQQVAEATDPRSASALEYHDGSSVATALAAGLASLIIYLANLMQIRYDQRIDGEAGFSGDFTKYVNRLASRENMKKAFDSISGETHHEKTFLPVWTRFGKAAESMSGKAVSEEKKWEYVKDLVLHLCASLKDEE